MLWESQLQQPEVRLKTQLHLKASSRIPSDAAACTASFHLRSSFPCCHDASRPFCWLTLTTHVDIFAHPRPFVPLRAPAGRWRPWKGWSEEKGQAGKATRRCRRRQRRVRPKKQHSRRLQTSNFVVVVFFFFAAFFLLYSPSSVLVLYPYPSWTGSRLDAHSLRRPSPKHTHFNVIVVHQLRCKRQSCRRR